MGRRAGLAMSAATENVGLPTNNDQARLQRLMANLRLGNGLILQSKALCQPWIESVHGPNRRAAVMMLLSS